MTSHDPMPEASDGHLPVSPGTGKARRPRKELIPNARAALWIAASAICFTAMTSLIKYLHSYPAPLQSFFSQLASLLMLTPVMLRSPRTVLPMHRLDLLAFRALTAAIGVMLAYYSFQKLPLATANALSFTRSLWIAPLAYILLREQLGPARLAALLVGFAGVILIIRPQASMSIEWAHGAAIVSAMLLALTVTSIKILSSSHKPVSILCWSAIFGVLMSIPLAVLNWQWPTSGDWLLLAAMGLASVGTQAFYIKGMSCGDAAALAPVDYIRLVFAVLAGLLVFGEVPGAWTLVGAALIIASTLFITIWETTRHRPGAA